MGANITLWADVSSGGCLAVLFWGPQGQEARARKDMVDSTFFLYIYFA